MSGIYSVGNKGTSQSPWCRYAPLLAHLSRRLKGELIVYTGIRRPSSVCRPSVRTFFVAVISGSMKPCIVTVPHTL